VGQVVQNEDPSRKFLNFLLNINHQIASRFLILLSATNTLSAKDEKTYFEKITILDLDDADVTQTQTQTQTE